MRIVSWKSPSRKFAQTEVDNFYDRQLYAPTLFRFKTSHTELPEHGGSLSLKLVLSGEEEYRIGRRSVVLRPGQFLFLNTGQHYSSRIIRETESVAIFFPDQDKSSLLEAALQADISNFSEDADYSLQPGIPQVPFRANHQSQTDLNTLISTLNIKNDAASREASQQLMITAVRNLHSHAPFSKLRSATKTGTRDELIRRLLKAKEQIDDSVDQNIDLDDLAITACLSKYYFLRLFTETFGISPCAYQRKLRLNSAVEKIHKGTLPQRAAKAAGYQDYRAFRRACQRLFNFDPAQNSQS